MIKEWTPEDWAPEDWDGQTYCITGCGSPATHPHLIGMAGEAPTTEMLCCLCWAVEASRKNITAKRHQSDE